MTVKYQIKLTSNDIWYINRVNLPWFSPEMKFA